MNRARFVAPAREEFLADVAYYDRVQPGQGVRFAAAVEEATARRRAAETWSCGNKISESDRAPHGIVNTTGLFSARGPDARSAASYLAMYTAMYLVSLVVLDVGIDRLSAPKALGMLASLACTVPASLVLLRWDFRALLIDVPEERTK